MKKYIVFSFLFFSFNFFTIANANINSSCSCDGKLSLGIKKDLFGPISSQDIRIYNDNIFVFSEGFWVPVEKLCSKNGALYVQTEKWYCVDCDRWNYLARYKCKHCGAKNPFPQTAEED